MRKQQVVVFDDLRTLENPLPDLVDVYHCRTSEEFLDILNTGTEIDLLFLDHDLGGQAFGEDTSREAAREYYRRIIDGELLAPEAIVIVTLNPAGADFLEALFEGMCLITRDPSGRQHGLVSPKGW